MPAPAKPRRKLTKRPNRQREGAYVGFRSPADLKEKLESAAGKAGRSLSSEAQFRLEQSFQRGALVREVLTLAFGSQIAAITLLLARAMYQSAFVARDCEKRGGTLVDSPEWYESPWAFGEVAKAAQTIFEALRPEGESVIPPLFPERLGYVLEPTAVEMNQNWARSEDLHPGVETANSLLQDIASGDAKAISSTELANMIEDLGALRMRVRERIAVNAKRGEPRSYAERLMGFVPGGRK